jgi:hypothetical protein
MDESAASIFRVTLLVLDISSLLTSSLTAKFFHLFHLVDKDPPANHFTIRLHQINSS